MKKILLIITLFTLFSDSYGQEELKIWNEFLRPSGKTEPKMLVGILTLNILPIIKLNLILPVRNKQNTSLPGQLE
jgi:hypothetical protein